VGLASAGTLAGTTVGTTLVGSLFGAGGAALTGKKARRRTSSRVKEFMVTCITRLYFSLY